MRYVYLRIFFIALSLASTLALSQDVTDESWIRLAARWIEIAGVFSFAALGFLTRKNETGWELRRTPAVVIVLLIYALFLCRGFLGGPSGWDLVEVLATLPLVWVATTVVLDLSGEVKGRENLLLRALRWTARWLKRPVVLVAGSLLVIASLFGKSDSHWITSDYWFAWHQDIANGIRNYGGQLVYWLLVAGALATLALIAIGRRVGKSAWVDRLEFAMLLLGIYAAIDGCFAIMGLELSQGRSDVTVFFAWMASEVAMLGFLAWERVRLGAVRPQTLATIVLCVTPLFQLGLTVCLGTMFEGLQRPDRFQLFYLGAALLAWGMGRRQVRDTNRVLAAAA